MLIAEAVAEDCLAAGLDVVIDAVNSVDPARDMWRGLAARQGTRLAIIECVLSDLALHHDRLAQRERGLALKEPTWAEVQRRALEWTPWPQAHLTIDAIDEPEANIAKVLAYLETIAARDPDRGGL